MSDLVTILYNLKKKYEKTLLIKKREIKRQMGMSRNTYQRIYKIDKELDNLKLLEEFIYKLSKRNNRNSNYLVRRPRRRVRYNNDNNNY